MRLPDGRRSWFLLIGASEYGDAQLPDLPAVAHNLADVAAVLTDPRLGGLPSDRCVTFLNPRDVSQLGVSLQSLAEEARDVLFVYYAGHGTVDLQGHLHLALPDTRPGYEQWTALAYDRVRQVVYASPAAIRVVVLDCCWSGLAVGGTMAEGSSMVAAQIAIDGTYVLTSTTANSPSYAPAGSRNTLFTGELVSFLRSGVPGGDELIPLREVYRHVRAVMVARGLPPPQQRATATAGDLALSRNPWRTPPAAEAPAPAAPPPPRPAVSPSPVRTATTGGPRPGRTWTRPAFRLDRRWLVAVAAVSLVVLVVGLVGLRGYLAGDRMAPPVPAAPLDQQILRINDGSDPRSLDPTQQVSSNEAAIGRLAFQPLLLPNARLTDVAPGAAASYEVSRDGLTYTFHLRTNAKWSDGRPVVALDWVYGLKHLLNPALQAGDVDPYFDGTIAGAAEYADVDRKSASAIDSFLNGLGISAPDDQTLVIKVQAPTTYFKWVMTLWVAVPLRKDVVEGAAGGPFASTDATKAEAWASRPETIVGNGPFKIAGYVPKDHVTLVPNSGYWGGAPRLQGIFYQFIPDANAAFAAYRTGLLDVLDVPVPEVGVVRQDQFLSKQARLTPRLATSWVTYDTRKAPLDDEKVRLALSEAIDRDKLTSDVLEGTGVPIRTLVPRGVNGYDPSLGDAQRFDVAAAVQLLHEAGVTPAQLSQLRLLTPNTPGDRAIDQFIVQQWQQNLGASIPLEVVDPMVATDRIRADQFDIYAPDGPAADFPDQEDWLGKFTSSSCHVLNWGCPNLPGYDRLVERANAASGDSQRNKLYAQAQKQLSDTAAVGFLYQSDEYDLVQPYVQGLTTTPFDDEGVPGDLSFAAAYIGRH